MERLLESETNVTCFQFAAIDTFENGFETAKNFIVEENIVGIILSFRFSKEDYVVVVTRSKVLLEKADILEKLIAEKGGKTIQEPTVINFATARAELLWKIQGSIPQVQS